jgi:putative ABC transport system ATP-binding protein
LPGTALKTGKPIMLVNAKNITRIYEEGKNKLFAVNDISIDIKHGDFVAIMGPSGCGKSTLLNILGLLDAPSKGDYKFEGKDVFKLSDLEITEIRREHVGFVFQSFNLLSQLSALENVMLPMKYANMGNSQAEQRAKKLLEDVGLGQMTHKTPLQLSAGQKQRVAIARALANKPQLVLADEPTGNLDSHSSMEVMEVFKNLNKDGHTVVFVTHDKNTANLAKRTLHMVDGKFVKNETKRNN